MDPFTGCFVPDSTSASHKCFVDTFVHDLLIELENNTSGFHFRKKYLYLIQAPRVSLI